MCCSQDLTPTFINAIYDRFDLDPASRWAAAEAIIRLWTGKGQIKRIQSYWGKFFGSLGGLNKGVRIDVVLGSQDRMETLLRKKEDLV